MTEVIAQARSAGRSAIATWKQRVRAIEEDLLNARTGRGAGGCIGQLRDERIRKTVLETLVVQEVKSLVLPNRAAQRRAQLVPMEWRRYAALIEKVRSIKFIVAVILVHAAVHGVSAGLEERIDYAAGLFAIFNRKIRGDHFEFFYGF